VGYNFLKKSIDRVLFLDVDEIVDGDRFRKFLEEKKYLKFDALRFSNYWYFRDASLQAKNQEDSVVFVKRKKIKYKSLLDSTERDAIFDSISGKKKRHVLGLDGTPMIHHYSWVRTKDQMLKKVGSWGHKNDKDWAVLVEEEFSHKTSKKDFVHGYELIEVEPFVSIDLNNIELKNLNKEMDNVIHLSKKELLGIIKKRSFKDYIHCYLEEKRLLKD
jgi:hypothetical protein